VHLFIQEGERSSWLRAAYMHGGFAAPSSEYDGGSSSIMEWDVN